MLKASPFRVVVVVGSLGALALSTPAGATITAIRLDPQTNPLGCADVTVATTTLVGSVTFAGFPAGTITSSPAVATACTGGAGRSISFDGPPGAGIAGTEVAIRGNDETAPLTSHVAVARADGATIHLREVPPGSTVNTVAASGASVDLTPIPVTTTIATTVGGRVVSVRYIGGNTPRTTFSVGVREPQTFVQINDTLPGVPTLVEMRGPDGALVFSRSVTSTESRSILLDGPALASGSSVRMAQSGLVDRTAALGAAEFRADGFRVALAPGATGGRYSADLAKG